jgi:toxin FitB
MWLLDTVTLSEMTKTNAKPEVLNWLSRQQPETFFTSAVCIGELKYGVERLPPGRRREQMRTWFESIVSNVLAGRIITFDVSVASTWAEARVYSPRTLPMIDSLIAATALNHGLTVVTRNAKDFEAYGVEVFNPWADDASFPTK